MLKVKQFYFNPFGESTFIVVDEATRECIVVDPGMVEKNEFQKFDKFIEENKLTITQIVNTHLHLDHCFGDNYVRDKYGAKVSAHIDDAFLGSMVADQAARFGLRLDAKSNVVIDTPLSDGDVIAIGESTLKVIHVPGHSPGGIALYSPEGKFAIVGDSLFEGSIGRTDLEGGDHVTLVRNVRDKLLTLPGDTMILPGHGGPTTVEREKQTNPYLK